MTRHQRRTADRMSLSSRRRMNHVRKARRSDSSTYPWNAHGAPGAWCYALSPRVFTDTQWGFVTAYDDDDLGEDRTSPFAYTHFVYYQDRERGRMDVLTPVYVLVPTISHQLTTLPLHYKLSDGPYTSWRWCYVDAPCRPWGLL